MPHLLCKQICKQGLPSGFSLIEMSVVIVIIGLLVGLGLTTGQMQVSTTKYQATQTTLSNTKTALDLYYTKYKRYPCPALPVDAPSAATYGFEVAGGCAAACPAGLTCPASSKAVIGALPYKTLNLGEEFASDEWGNKLNYTVDKDFTVANTTAIYGSIPVMDKNGNEITQSADGGKAIYTVLSTGMAANGAWRKSGGARLGCDTTRKDGNNCSGAASLTDTGMNDGAAAGTGSFDNLLAWKTRESTDHIVIAAPSSSAPTTPAPTNGFLGIVSGSFHTCGIYSGGKLGCTGDASMGQLGHGCTAGSSTFVQETGGFTDWTQISASYARTCGIRGGHAYCTGTNDYGAVGDGTTTLATSFTEVSGGFSDWTYIATGLDHTCGIRGGRAYCWGLGDDGQLGNAANSNSSVPALVMGGLTNWINVAAGQASSCGVTGTGALYCWGSNWYGESGHGAGSNTPVSVSGGITNWKKVSGKGFSFCGIQGTGHLYCWGDNSNGSIGDGTTTQRNAPVEVSGAYLDWTYVSNSVNTTCGIRSSGAAYCWGYNDDNQLGDGTNTTHLTPNIISGGFTDWTSVEVNVNDSGTCGTRADGSLYCWGESGLSGGMNDMFGNNGASAHYNLPTLMPGP